MRAFVPPALMLLLFSAPVIAAPGQKLCGTAQLRQLHPVPTTPFHGPFPGGRGMPTVGDTQDFWTYDLSVMPPKNAQIPSTCRGASEQVAVWIADDQWESKVTQADVDALMAAMQSATPRTAESGIVANNEMLFGAPPQFHEGDPDVTLLVYDIAGYNGYVFDGFFRREDLDPFNPACASNPMLYCSNELAMVHVSSDNVGGDYMVGVVAHEAEHLAHFGQDPFEENWLDETMAELAMAYSGFQDPSNLQAYVNNPALPLVLEPPVHYGACFLFGSYLFDRLGIDGVHGLVASSKKGMASIDEVVPHGGFDVLFGEYAAANLLDDPTVEEGEFGHTLIDVPTMKSSTFGSSPTKDIAIQPSALSYIKLFWQMDSTETYQVTFDAKGTRAHAYVVHLPTNSVWALSSGQPVELPLFDDPTVTFALSNPDPAAKASVSLTIEIVEGEHPVVVEEPMVIEEPIAADLISEPDTAIETDIADTSPTPEDVGSVTTQPGDGCNAGSSNSTAAGVLFGLLLLLAVMRWRQTAPKCPARLTN